MSRKPSKEHLARIRRVERALGDKVICNSCGATLADVHVKCTARLDLRCEGFEAIDRAGQAA